MNQLSRRARTEVGETANSIKGFARHFTGVRLHPYQLKAAEAIIHSVYERDGKTFVIIFSRQSGKDEILALVVLFLMFRFNEWGAEIVCAQPTFKPQTINAMERLMKRGINFGTQLSCRAGYIIRLGAARTVYFSADPSASQVGATADRLLIMNEAQDIDPKVYDKRFSPMAASGYATKVFSGTSWTSGTLLAREKRSALKAEEEDGIKRVFIVDADQVSRLNPLYARHVADEVKKLGRNHPLIRSQYFCEEIDAQVGMFNPGRMALMQGDECSEVSDLRAPDRSPERPITTRPCAFLLDVAGQDEARMNMDDTAPLNNSARDAASLTITSIDLSSIPTLQAPTFRFVNRQQWVGLNHLVLFGRIKSLVESWKPQYIVMDATGVGEGLWAMLDKAFPGRVIPVKFSQQVKSELGWRYLAMIETGRVRDCCPSDQVLAQYQSCQSEIMPGPGKVLRWGVPEGARGQDGELIHDDYLLADALVAELDRLKWVVSTDLSSTEGFDPLMVQL
jgi:hypothetical protein